MEREDLASVLDDIRYLAERQDVAMVRTVLLTARPADVAEIVRHLPEDLGRYVFGLLDPERASDVLLELDDFSRERLAAGLDRERLSALIDVMDSDDAADVVKDLPASMAESVLETIPDEDSAEVRVLLQHEEDTAGGLMQLELVAVPAGSTVDEAIQEVRRRAGTIEHVYDLYVIGAGRLLRGVLSLDRLLTAAGSTRVEAIMDENAVVVEAGVDQEEVAKLFKRYNLIALPVVDRERRLVGRITVDDVIDVVVDEASEDIRKLAGVVEEEYRETSPFRVSRARLPWLLLGLTGGVCSAALLSRYEGSLARNLPLAFFVPVVTAMGGNIGIQSSAIVISGLASGEISLRDSGRRILQELRVGLLNAIVCGLAIALVASPWQGQEIGLVVTAALITVILSASFIGSTVPLVLHRFGLDPSLATGPFITASNDIFGLVVYMTIAGILR
jgi:magnesium transporter